MKKRWLKIGLVVVVVAMAFVLTGCPATIMNPFMGGYYPPGYYPTQYAWQLEGWRNFAGQFPPPPGGYPGGHTGGGGTYSGHYATQDGWRNAH